MEGGLFFLELPDIYLKGPREATKHLSQDSRSPGQDLNPGPPENEGVRITRLLCSVF
jgi:hypothetical protein